MSDELASDIQKPDIGSLVTLYQFDATKMGAPSIWYFTQAVQDGAPVVFNSQEYTPIDIKADGFDITTEGTSIRPRLAVSNVDNTLASEVISYKDFLGCKLTRIRTLLKYIGDTEEAITDESFDDITDHNGESIFDTTGGGSESTFVEFPRDIYIIQQKIIQNKKIIQWELVAKTDLENLKIPRRQVLRDTCTHTYRYYQDGAFVYTDVSCPYTGATYYEQDGTLTTNPAEDVCGKKLSDCKLRYPLDSDQLPTRAFPMVARTRF